MKKQNSMVLPSQNTNVSLIGALRLAFAMWLSSDNKFMTSISEEKVSNKQAILIWNVLISFVLLIGFVASDSIIVPLVLAGYFSFSAYLCWKGGIR